MAFRRRRHSHDPFRPRRPKDPSQYEALRPTVFAVAYIGYVTAYLVRNNFRVTSFELTTQHDWSMTQVGMVLTGFTITYGLGKVIMGIAVDNMSLTRVFSFALALSSLCCIGMGVTTNPHASLVLMILNGLAQGALAPGALALLGAWYPNKMRGSRIAIWNTSQNVGAALLPLVFGIGAAFVVPGGRTSAFIIPGCLGLLVALWVWRTNLDRPWRQGFPTLTMMFGRGGTPAISLDDDDYWNIVKTHVLTSRAILILIGINTLLYLIRFGVINWISFFTHSRGYDARSSDLTFAALELAAIPACLGFAWLAYRHPNRIASLGGWSMVALAAALALWPLTPDTQTHVIVSLVLGALIYGPQIAVNVLTVNMVPPQAIGIATGIVGCSGYLVGETMANIAIPRLVDVTGWELTYVALAVCALVAAVGYWSLRGWEKKLVIVS